VCGAVRQRVSLWADLSGGGFLTDDCTAFGDGSVAIDDHRRQSQWMHILQTLRSQVIRVPLPFDDFIRYLEFLLYIRVSSVRNSCRAQATGEKRTSNHKIF
jgi:hypothetical protein